MPQRLPKSSTPVSFTTARACTVYVILVLHTGVPASSLTFTPSLITNRSVDHADHHRHRSTNSNNIINDNNGRTSSSSWSSPACSRRGRKQRGPSSLFAQLRSDALFGNHDARGGGGGGRSSSGGRGRGGGGTPPDTTKRSATAAATDVFKEDEPYVLEGVKNIRDLSSIEGYGIAPGRVFRTGHLSAATERDAKTLRDSTGLRTLVSTGGE